MTPNSSPTPSNSIGGPSRRRVTPSGRQDWSTWPSYDAAVTGFDGYWYPVMWGRDLGRKPHAVRLLGERVALVRDAGRVYALADRCPHRGVPLSYGTRELPGTISCRYHGWTFDLETGTMCAALTDGPDSPINGRVGVPTYPAAERLGLIWVYVGPQDDPPPVERDIPAELVENDCIVGGKVQAGREGNWRLAAENGFDEGHAKYLHRNSLWQTFRTAPAWAESHVTAPDKSGWITRVRDAAHWEYRDPQRGVWSVDRWWRRRTGYRPTDSGSVDPVIAGLELEGRTSIRVPGQLRVAYPMWIHYEFYVPEDAGHHRYVQIAVSFQKGFRAFGWTVEYVTLIRPLFHGQFTGQDTWMVHVMDAPPEKLYRPDASITAWRKLCQTSGARPRIPRTPLLRPAPEDSDP